MTQPTLVSPFGTLSLLKTLSLLSMAVCAAFTGRAQSTTFECVRPDIEAVQRAMQERYVTYVATARANGVSLVGFPDEIDWPNLKNGMESGSYPKDGFYDMDLLDSETQVMTNSDLLYSLIADLANKLSNYFPYSEFLDPAYYNRLDGLYVSGGALPSLSPPVYPGSQVDPGSYIEYMDTIREKLREMRYPLFSAFSTDLSGAIGTDVFERTCFYPVELDCDSIKQRTIDCWASDIPSYVEEFLLGKVEGIFFYDDGPAAYSAHLTNWHGRFAFDFANLRNLGGEGKVIMSQLDAALHSIGYASTMPLEGTSAPFSDYDTWHIKETVDLSGSNYVSEIFGEVVGPEFEADCPTQPGISQGSYFGYAVQAIVIAAPEYKETLGQDSRVECECATCSEGCAIGGNSSQKNGSIDYDIPLGSGRDGAIGSIGIYSDTADFLMASPFGLNYSTNGEAIVLHDSSYEDIPRQIVTEQGLVDIVVTYPFKSYEMRFYDSLDRGSVVDGFYQPVSGNEIKTVTVENPDLQTTFIPASMDLGISNVLMQSPGHGLTVGSYYALRVDADSGPLPQGNALGRLSRKDLYYVYAYDSDNLALLYFDQLGNGFLDAVVDYFPGQILKISSPFNFGALDITEVTDSRMKTIEYAYVGTTSDGVSAMTVTNGDHVRTSVVSISPDAVDPNLLIETEEELDGDGNTISKTQRSYRVYPFNVPNSPDKNDQRTLISEIMDPDGDALTTMYSYYDDFAGDGFEQYGHLKEMLRYDGYWERYVYDADGKVIELYSPYLNSPPSFDGGTCRLKERSEGAIPDQDGDGLPEYAITHVEKVLGQEVSRSYSVTYSQVVDDVQRTSEIRCLETVAAWDTATNLVSSSWSYVDGEFEGERVKAISEDGLLTTYGYVWDEAAGLKTVTVENGAPDANFESVVAGQRSVVVTTGSGALLDRSLYDIESGILVNRDYSLEIELDEFGRVTKVYHLDGTATETAYQDCCGTYTETDKTGIQSVRMEDLNGRVLTVTRDGIESRFEEAFDSDASDGITGLERRDYRKGRASATDQLLSIRTFDQAGRLIASLDPRDGIDRLTRYDEFLNTDGYWESQATLPNGAVRLSLRNGDGSGREERFDGELRAKYEYGVESDSHDGVSFIAWTEKTILVGDGDSELEWSKSHRDPLGRVYKTEIPDAEGNEADIFSYNFYDANGRLVRSVDPDGVTRLLQYNSEGQLEYSVLDVDKDGIIDFDGNDRITRTEIVVVNDMTKGDLIRTTQSVWEAEGADVAIATSVSESSTNRLNTWEAVYDQTSQVTVSYPGSGSVVSSRTRPDGTVETVETRNGFPSSQKVSHPVEGDLSDVSNTPDEFDRVVRTVDNLTGAVTAFSYYDSDLLQSQTSSESSTGAGDPQITSFVYDEMNRLVTTTLANGELSEVRYDAEGNQVLQYGFNVTPVEYSYDRQNRMETMTTWKKFDDASGTGVAGSVTTTWNYNANGRLASKLDHAGKGPSYEYTSGGRLRTRKWARLGLDGIEPLATTYVYGSGGEADQSVETGDLRGIYYSNDPANTPAVERGYDRQGRVSEITDASGLRSLSYDEGRLDAETYASGTLSGHVIDRSFDSLNRYAGIGVADSGSASIYSLTYGYDGASRLQTVGYAGHAVSYSYDPTSSTRMSIDYNNGSQSVMTVNRNFDLLGRLTSRVSTVGSETVSYAYDYNSTNQRTKATLADGMYWDYLYDDRGQVTSGVKKSAAGVTLPGYAFEYGFDAIGNRESATRNGSETAYAPNLLNQYASLDLPRELEVAGSANALASVFVDEVPVAEREGALFFHQLDFSNEANASEAISGTLEIKGVLSGGGFEGADRVAIEERDYYLPPATVSYSYDDDGNLLSDGRWTYEWNAENRLVALETHFTAFTAGVERLRLEFAYDSQGRRFSKKVYEWDEASSSFSLQSSLLFVYDGWNLLMELAQDIPNSTFAIQNSFVWGLDLSNTSQGAGGVGGLLIAEDSSGSAAYPAYDGNGNVVSYVSTAGGTLSWSGEYGPFGEGIGDSSGGLIPFGFSTKYRDEESGYSYYGFRYYDSNTGRWLSRDPIEEDGGINVYSFVGNDGVNNFDVLGLYEESGHFYSIYSVAVSAGRSPKEAFQLAYYAQLPDEFHQLDAKTAYLAAEGDPFLLTKAFGYEKPASELLKEYLKGTGVSVNDFGRDVQEIIHSLHGLGGKELQDRRECLSELIRSGSLKPWEQGILLHAFGDSFAHVFADKSGYSAYGYPGGHGNDSIADRTPGGRRFTDPDVIGNFPSRYSDYLEGLYGSGLGGKGDPIGKLLPLFPLTQLKGSSNSGNANALSRKIAESSFRYGQTPFPNYAPETGHRVLNNASYPTPSAAQIIDLFKKVKQKCCVSP